jgi:hypothetical protein
MKIRLTAAQRQRLGLRDDATAAEVVAAVRRAVAGRRQPPQAAADDELYAALYPNPSADHGHESSEATDDNDDVYRQLFPEAPPVEKIQARVGP